MFLTQNFILESEKGKENDCTVRKSESDFTEVSMHILFPLCTFALVFLSQCKLDSLWFDEKTQISFQTSNHTRLFFHSFLYPLRSSMGAIHLFPFLHLKKTTISIGTAINNKYMCSMVSTSNVCIHSHMLTFGACLYFPHTIGCAEPT